MCTLWHSEFFPFLFPTKMRRGGKRDCSSFCGKTKLELHQYSLFFCPVTEDEGEKGTL